MTTFTTLNTGLTFTTLDTGLKGLEGALSVVDGMGLQVLRNLSGSVRQTLGIAEIIGSLVIGTGKIMISWAKDDQDEQTLKKEIETSCSYALNGAANFLRGTCVKEGGDIAAGFCLMYDWSGLRISYPEEDPSKPNLGQQAAMLSWNAFTDLTIKTFLTGVSLLIVGSAALITNPSDLSKASKYFRVPFQPKNCLRV